jgi:hypothetical protein
MGGVRRERRKADWVGRLFYNENTFISPIQNYHLSRLSEILTILDRKNKPLLK